jgi:hypothetical protein
MHLVVAYLVAAVLIGGYCLWLLRGLRSARREVRALRDHLKPR